MTTTEAQPRRPASRRNLLLHELPYLGVLAFVVCGVAYSSLMHAHIEAYWAFVAVISCAACIYTGWTHSAGRKERVRLVWTQLLHWGAFLAVMGLVFLPSVQSDATANETSLVVMLLLALGTFVAGAHTLSWRMSLNGIVMGMFIPAVAWLDQAALVISLIVLAVVLVVAGVVVWRTKRGTAHHPAPS